MAIIEQTKTLISGIEVQPIINHGKPAWRIFKPSGDGIYVTQFTASLAAITVTRWTREVYSMPDVVERLKGMHNG